MLHHFLSGEDLSWLQSIPHELSDGQRIALIFVREQGAVDNQTLRQLTGSEVLAASQELRKLRDLRLLCQKGKGSATYYVPGIGLPQPTKEGHSDEQVTLEERHGTLASGHGTLAAGHGTLAGKIPPDLVKKLGALGQRPGGRIRPIILELCTWREFTAAQLAELFGRSDSKALKRDHLGPMVEAKQLEHTIPDMERHPKQAYRAVIRDSNTPG